MAGGTSRSSALVHGTCVGMYGTSALIRGKPGAGKSDLALRFLEQYPDDARLVADDQVQLRMRDGRLFTSVPETIKDMLEVRGVGIIEVPCEPEMPLGLIIDLVPRENVPRLPPDPLPCEEILGCLIPLATLAAFEPSAPAKLRLLLAGVTGN